MSCLCPNAPYRHDPTCQHSTMEMFRQVPGPSNFKRDLEELVNRHSMENTSNTPDYVLAQYLSESLRAFDRAVMARDLWYGGRRRPSESTSNVAGIDSAKEGSVGGDS